MTYVWKSAVHVNQDLRDSTHFGWMKNHEKYKPFITEKLPVPESVIELSMSSC